MGVGRIHEGKWEGWGRQEKEGQVGLKFQKPKGIREFRESGGRLV